jgi:imidazole glycerol-phosphate synthase subunit HisF
MRTKRVIARLDVKNETLVKGIHLEGLRVLGKPEAFAEFYYHGGIDELFYMDVVASLYGRNGLLDIVKRTAKKVFVPLMVGGGIRTLEDVRALLSSGADKVCINTAAVKAPDLIEKFANAFGSSTIAVAIEVIKDENQCYKVFIENGREHTGLDAIEWAKTVESLGAGEIVVTSVDRDGTGEGMLIELMREISDRVSIPVIAHGGVGCSTHFVKCFEQTKVSGICAASIFHYDAIKHLDLNLENVHGNLSFINVSQTRKNIEAVSIKAVKEKLKDTGIITR